MREYDEITLHKVQRAELTILKDFMDLCDRHGLIYFGIAGTGIGALRHQGFIPWDDDIDIAMPRPDFEKFLLLAKDELSDRYTVMNARENENYPLMTTRLMMNHTKFREEALRNIDCPLGIFLDLYPFDSVSDDPRKRKKQFRKAMIYSKLLILRSIPFPVLPFRGIKAKIVHAGCWCFHVLLKIFGFSKRKLRDKCDTYSRMFNETEPDSEYVDFLCDTTPYLNLYRRSDIFPLQKLPFEDVMLNFPRNMHDNLTGMYGDYMQLPPVEKRKNHFPFCLEFAPEMLPDESEKQNEILKEG